MTALRALRALPQKSDLLSFRPGFSPVTRLALKSRRTVLTVYSSSDLLKAVELERVSGTHSGKPLNGFLGLQQASTTGLKPGVNETELLRQSGVTPQC